jgi:hypothetical protein
MMMGYINDVENDEGVVPRHILRQSIRDLKRNRRAEHEEMSRRVKERGNVNVAIYKEWLFDSAEVNVYTLIEMSKSQRDMSEGLRNAYWILARQTRNEASIQVAEADKVMEDHRKGVRPNPKKFWFLFQGERRKE